MKTQVIGGIMVNVWDSEQELTRRQSQGKEVSRRLELDAVWTNRVVQLAQGISGTHWQLVKKLSKRKLQEIIENMMKAGFPGDVPYKDQLVYLDAKVPTTAEGKPDVH